MNSGINLITKKEDVGLKEKKKVKIARIIAGCALGITVFTSIILFILYNQLQIASIKRDQESAIRNMTILREKSAKLDAVNDRVKSISDIVKKRKNYIGTINLILKQLPKDASIATIDLSSKAIDLRITSSSLLALNIFLDNMIGLAEKKELVSDLTIDGLSLDAKNNKYNLTVSSKLL